MTSSRGRLPTLVLLALLTPTAVRAAEGPWADTEQSRVRLVSRWAAASTGDDAGLAVEFRLAPGWHVYWKDAGDAGYPPELRASGDLTSAKLRFPPPHRYDLPGGLEAIGYEKRVLYPVDGRVATAASGTARIRGTIDYLVCAESCIPYAHDLALELPLEAAPREDPATAAEIDAARASLPVAMTAQPGGLSRARADGRPDGTVALELELWLPATTLGESPDLFFEPDERVDVDRPTVGEGTDGALLARASARRLGAASDRLDVTLRWTAVGLEREGRPLALEGTLPVVFGGAPATAPRSGVSRPLVALLATLAVMALVLLRRRGAPSADGSV